MKPGFKFEFDIEEYNDEESVGQVVLTSTPTGGNGDVGPTFPFNNQFQDWSEYNRDFIQKWIRRPIKRELNHIFGSGSISSGSNSSSTTDINTGTSNNLDYYNNLNYNDNNLNYNDNNINNIKNYENYSNKNKLFSTRWHGDRKDYFLKNYSDFNLKNYSDFKSNNYFKNEENRKNEWI